MVFVKFIVAFDGDCAVCIFPNGEIMKHQKNKPVFARRPSLAMTCGKTQNILLYKKDRSVHQIFF